MKYIVTIVETVRNSEMVEADDEQSAFEKVNDYEFRSIASHETRTKHVEIKPAEVGVSVRDTEDEVPEIQTVN